MQITNCVIGEEELSLEYPALISEEVSICIPGLVSTLLTLICFHMYHVAGPIRL